MLEKLSSKGFSDYRIAKSISTPDKKVSASIIYRLRTGVHASTSYERGRMISDFYRMNCGNSETIKKGKNSGAA